MLQSWNNGNPTPEFNNAAQVRGSKGEAVLCQPVSQLQSGLPYAGLSAGRLTPG